jgi:hypothetical protein
MACEPRDYVRWSGATADLNVYDPVCPGHPMRAAVFDDFDERLPQRVHSINFVSSSSTVWSW